MYERLRSCTSVVDETNENVNELILGCSDSFIESTTWQRPEAANRPTCFVHEIEENAVWCSPEAKTKSNEQNLYNAFFSLFLFRNFVPENVAFIFFLLPPSFLLFLLLALVLSSKIFDRNTIEIEGS